MNDQKSAEIEDGYLGYTLRHIIVTLFVLSGFAEQAESAGCEMAACPCA